MHCCCLCIRVPIRFFDQPINSQNQPEGNQWNGGGSSGYYGYAQGYENYGYAPAPAAQDPNMYGGYPGYGNYQPPQQQQQMGYSWENPPPFYEDIPPLSLLSLLIVRSCLLLLPSLIGSLVETWLFSFLCLLKTLIFWATSIISVENLLAYLKICLEFIIMFYLISCCLYVSSSCMQFSLWCFEKLTSVEGLIWSGWTLLT